jgi:hypothetical protein
MIAFRDPLRRAFGMDVFAGPGTQRLTCINAGSAEVYTTAVLDEGNYRLQWR